MLNNKPFIITLMFAFFAFTPADSSAQDILYQPSPDSPIGERNPKGPSALAQFDFVIGDWDVYIEFKGQNDKLFKYNAKWHNHWINDGFDIHQEWRGPYLTGSEFRHYDPKLGHWVGMNIYVGGVWRSTTAMPDGDNMIVIINSEDNEGKPFLNRETYFEITADSWKMKSDISYDNGETWATGQYHMVAARHMGEK